MSGCRIGRVILKGGAELRRFPVVARDLNVEAIGMVSDLLDDLRSGEVRAIGFVAVKRGGFVSTGFSNSPEGSYHAITSGAAVLAARLATSE